MKKMKSWIWVERLGLCCLVLTGIALCITITINFRPLYSFDLDFLQIVTNTSLDKATLMKNYGELLTYLNNPFQQSLSLSDFPVSVSGAFHFYEVKRLFLLCYGVLLLTIVPSVLFLHKLAKQRRLWRLIRPAQWGMLIPIVFGLVMMLGFDQFFVSFHHIFFRNDDWLFDPITDPIINVLPEQFFMHCFFLFFLLIEGFFLSGYLVGKYELKKKNLF